MEPFKIGHRGAKGHMAENTLESIQKAIDLGVHGVEIDIHKCASGELVVFHDFTLDRITDGTGEISKKSLSELKKLKVMGQYAIPTLHEVMQLMGDLRPLLNLELKGQNTGEAIVEIMDYYVDNHGWKWRDFIVSSFQKELLQDVFHSGEPFMTGVLTDTNLEDAIDFAQAINAVSIHPDYTMLTKENVQLMQSLGFQVMTYTVNDKADIERMHAYGVDGIISDFPDRI
ncbi:glycerophosphodiester phosphodiesterase [Hyunsoonleella sp. SJ7]|uniref:Glycerophosphodiester phosphodiesterase n=1 Tax=Hyunsoonleella aquatilis TaxID=2762758 RepID=A0A923KJ95_9FLAO|nr:glycerophosphodiester phosphodiesterase family protein [Hyunsoonleella aquatilis]MBC3757087.1 glycerophosphodiester phosphodiesterase [Hyunsoonleella aquatilis]